MKNRIIGEIYVPVMEPFHIHAPDWQGVFVQTFKEILSLKRFDLSHTDEVKIFGKIDAKPPSPKYKKYLLEAQKASSRKYKYFRIVASLSNKPMPYVCSDETKGNALWVNKELLEEALSKGACDIVVVANLSRPGSIEIGCPVTFINGKYYRTRDHMLACGIRDSIMTAVESKWPPLTNIALSKTINWLSSPAWLLYEYSGSALIRALNAFTYLFAPEPELSALGLMYSLMGIEALYAKGYEESIGEQILKKTQIVLGAGEGLRKKIKSMYDLRSRLVHGQLDIVPCFTDWDTSELEKSRNQLFKSDNLAISILIATFQKMILEGWKTLTFDYQLKEKQ